MRHKIAIMAAALALAASPLTLERTGGGSMEAFAQSDTAEDASGGVAGGEPAGSGGATGEDASGGVAGGDSLGSEGSAAGGDGPSATGEKASGGVAGGPNGEVSENLGGLAGLPEAERQSSLEALSEEDRAALKEECVAVNTDGAAFSAEVVAVCMAVEEL